MRRWAASAAWVLLLMGCAGALCAQSAGTPPPAAANSPDKAAADASATCATCHAEIAQTFNGSAVTHAGKGVTCANCHAVDKNHGDASGAARPMRNAAAEEKATCSQCHADVAGPYAHEHPVIEVEGCVTCHAAHGSANAGMLNKSDVNAICAQCHLPEHAKGGQRAAVSQAGQAGQAAAGKAAACTSCHEQIHGSSTSEVFSQ
ncbi:MAG TPA: cytochrome c3 family protein [Acidobacteriaceae bacterium]|jgi:predicted CXXCH cytochrome family protein|nr:cytochrome c3 family protein [Acidobacteriaceae bacterium]